MGGNKCNLETALHLDADPLTLLICSRDPGQAADPTIDGIASRMAFQATSTQRQAWIRGLRAGLV